MQGLKMSVSVKYMTSNTKDSMMLLVSIKQMKTQYSQLRLYRGRLLRETGCSAVTTMAPIFSS